MSHDAAGSLFGIGSRVAGTAQEIVHTGMVVVRQPAQDLRRDHMVAPFIVGIGPLCDIDGSAQFFLGKVFILAKVSQSQIHVDHRDQHIPDQNVLLRFRSF